MDDKIIWHKTYTGTRGFWVAGTMLVSMLVLIVVSFVLFISINRWEIAISLTVLFLIGFALFLRAVLFFRRNWCTEAALYDDGFLVRCKDGTIRKIHWNKVSRIKMLKTGSRFTGTVQSQIILHGEKYDNAVVTGDAAKALYEEWMRRKGGF